MRTETPSHAINQGEQTQRSEEIYARIRSDILNGRLAAGQMFSESELAEHYHTTRSPLRHALARGLESGWLRVKARQGYVVVGLDLSDAREIFVVRSLIEPTAAALACQFITHAELDRLFHLAGVRYASDDDQSQLEFMDANRELHVGIAHASRNRRLESIVERLLDDMQRIIHQVLPFQEWGGMVEDHQRIVEVIATRDPEKARQVMLEAIDGSRRRVFGVLNDRSSS